MTDYKNTPKGRIVRQKYADILPLLRPEPIRPRMNTQNRAKIFSPFSALRGYDEEISDEDRVHGLMAKIELSNEDKNRLSDRLLQTKKNMSVTVEYFHTDKMYAPLGTYKTLTGTVSRIDPMYQEIEIIGDTGSKTDTPLEKAPSICIAFDDLFSLESSILIFSSVTFTTGF